MRIRFTWGCRDFGRRTGHGEALYSAVGVGGFGVEDAVGVEGFGVEDVAGAGWVMGGGAVSAMRRLLSRLRCLVTKVLMTCAASLAELLPQFPCSHSTATTMSGLRRGAMPTNQALGRSCGRAGAAERVVAHDLGGAGLAGEVDALEMRNISGADRAAGDVGHRVGDQLPVLGGDGMVASPEPGKFSWMVWSISGGTSSSKTT